MASESYLFLALQINTYLSNKRGKVLVPEYDWQYVFNKLLLVFDVEGAA